VEVTLVPDERVETLVRTLVEHLAAFGGIPLVTVFDRPKTIALKWGRDGVVTEWNPTVAGVALDFGIGVEVCWPYRPQEKGSVENLVGWVKGSFFKQRRFLDQRDLERQLRDWLTDRRDRHRRRCAWRERRRIAGVVAAPCYTMATAASGNRGRSTVKMQPRCGRFRA
jgi:transposase